MPTTCDVQKPETLCDKNKEAGASQKKKIKHFLFSLQRRWQTPALAITRQNKPKAKASLFYEHDRFDG